MNKTVQAVESAAAGDAFHIEDVYPLIDNGRFPVKRIAGERVDVWADVYRDGHDVMAVALVWRLERERDWRRVPMTHHSNDRWVGSFVPDQPGRYFYAIEAWTDHFATWRRGFDLKQKAGADLSLDAIEGAGMLTKAQAGGHAAAAVILRQCEDFLQTGETAPLLTDELQDAMAESQLRPDLTRSPLFPLVADRPRARNGAWYQMVPRSQGQAPDSHGTFKDCIARLPDIAAMGFDVVCLTPIHPIGQANRRGRNNSANAADGDPGNLYAIGAAEGGHDSVHPQLGTLEDFRSLVAACQSHNMEVALDFAVQFSPDHPWLAQHPQWFKRRPDGSMRYAENPPEKYDGKGDDVVNPDFTSEDAGALWNASRDVVLFWVDQGVRIFRVDNPHRKPFPFWEWLIHEVQIRQPDVIFVAEAVTRSKLMKGLAKLGFTQSYSYFTWQTQRSELEQYLNELTAYPERDFYRPNFFANAPDVLPYHLQGGESWMFKSRVALAATLSSITASIAASSFSNTKLFPARRNISIPRPTRSRCATGTSPATSKPTSARSTASAGKTRRCNKRPICVSLAPMTAMSSASSRNRSIKPAASSSPLRCGASRTSSGLPLDDVQVGMLGDRRNVAALENLMTGERYPVEWGGVRLRIDPEYDPALLFRCLA